ncbi:hypothetical protein [Algoriphagus halophilus]|uniref:Uncharacterized protein n=1 Tax=Algoriphagus halophilus TaxID=226505 RepID=A0A1N6D402_9BACT|nr:hypothetical protein [Algoriphagus halophilus]SIN65426.1 hypothetical protein SAMN05444394_0138 [Algoriphagus halophilus]
MKNPFIVSSNSIMKFGQYKGIKVGIIFLFDPEYIEYMIREHNYFSITDLNFLEKNGVINKNGWIKKFSVWVDQTPFMKKYNSYQEFINNEELLEYTLSDETKIKNKENSTGKKVKIKTIK